MTEATTTAQRFALDEARAAEWVRRAVAAWQFENAAEGTDPGEHADNEDLPAIGAKWDAREVDQEDTVFWLVRLAVDREIITAPHGMDVDFEYVADSDGGMYRFLVTVTKTLTLASYGQEMRKLAVPDLTGMDAALDILREAVQIANYTLRQLDEYVASLSEDGCE